MISYFRLPLAFDVSRMRSDVRGFQSDEWVAHFNASYFDGVWSGLPLRSVAGSATHIYPDPSQQAEWADTAFLARCPYLREVLAAFRCPQKSVRLLKLGAGSLVREHRDHELSFEDGEIRIHVPILTNPAVEFVLAGRRLVLGEGESWYINFNLPHRVVNRGATDRIHLVIDCVVNDWLRELFSSAPLETTAVGTEQVSSPDGFERFRELVLGDAALQERLRDIVDRQTFVTVAIELGRERGCLFTAGDVANAIQAGRKSWQDRWTAQP